MFMEELSVETEFSLLNNNMHFIQRDPSLFVCLSVIQCHASYQGYIHGKETLKKNKKNTKVTKLSNTCDGFFTFQ